MPSKRGNRRVFGWVVLLFALIPGFPLWLLAIALVCKLFGLGGAAFLPIGGLFVFYYGIPARIFGESLIPVQEFGPNPTAGGFAASFIFYALIAGGLSCLIWMWRKPGEH